MAMPFQPVPEAIIISLAIDDRQAFDLTRSRSDHRKIIQRVINRVFSCADNRGIVVRFDRNIAPAALFENCTDMAGIGECKGTGAPWERRWQGLRKQAGYFGE